MNIRRPILLLLALLPTLSCARLPAESGPVVAEWPAQKLVYVAEGGALRMFRVGTGFSPLAERRLPPGAVRSLQLNPASGRLLVDMEAGGLDLDARLLR